jgi:hypothetical protein
MEEEGRKQAQNKFTDGKSCEVINFNKTSLLGRPRDYSSPNLAGDTKLETKKMLTILLGFLIIFF